MIIVINTLSITCFVEKSTIFRQDIQMMKHIFIKCVNNYFLEELNI
jgi:hypothetical protein